MSNSLKITVIEHLQDGRFEPMMDEVPPICLKCDNLVKIEISKGFPGCEEGETPNAIGTCRKFFKSCE